MRVLFNIRLRDIMDFVLMFWRHPGLAVLSAGVAIGVFFLIRWLIGRRSRYP